ncbi:hypothetical protein M406DRAFT_354012 [Cryphonectria parasitica EP155]|uniref:SnoaL-like domain-containing protein n=1 Tax=Cryphonectria parasitica (strain ATCC 38755 / EP155) TaxID=660469 RepID=A0A9P4Y9S5_CRYP1|nr:uncharacterized protein M406DRAFT_354012 [Cryphonectria parasitica EP155]KAF3769438.1 hypothetical protein M406DRAFT_354012 [Cryphonectria parasitica EP155]
MAPLSGWTLPVTLSPPLSGREAVADALYRCVTGLDTNDVDLFRSAFHQDASFTLNGYTMNGLASIVSDCFDNIAKLETTHFVTNTRIHIADGGSQATLSASTLAQHYRGGQGMKGNADRFLTGALYLLELAKDSDGTTWKITNWKMQSTWGEGDIGIVTGK